MVKRLVTAVATTWRRALADWPSKTLGQENITVSLSTSLKKNKTTAISAPGRTYKSQHPKNTLY